MSYSPSPPQGQWRPASPPLAPNGQPLATFLDRFLAYLIDLAIWTGVGLVIALPATFLWIAWIISSVQSGREPDPMTFVVGYLVLYAALIVFYLLFAYVYYVEYQLRRNGQTVGKKVMKIWVIPANPAARITRGHLVKRWAVQSVVAQVIPLFGLFDGLWQLWDKPLQQCLHDKAAETVVVKLG